jgi:Reverse transcriptase (RNA-dependent DNA polymerase)/RNase H-like domain found in reverse transcriptase
MFFGLQNSPLTFQAMMNGLFDDLICAGKIVIYMDDILILSSDLEEHRRTVKQVLQRLIDNDLYLKPEKCFFEKESIKYLSMIISHNQVHMDPAKVATITEWPTPKTVKDVQSFLGFGNLYRCFILDFLKISKPLTKLTRKDTPFSWTPEWQTTFDALKHRFTTAPILLMPDFDAPFKLETDASDFDYSVILSQRAPIHIGTLSHICPNKCCLQNATMSFMTKSFSPSYVPWKPGATTSKEACTRSRFGQTTKIWNILKPPNPLTNAKPDGACSYPASTSPSLIDPAHSIKPIN